MWKSMLKVADSIALNPLILIETKLVDRSTGFDCSIYARSAAVKPNWAILKLLELRTQQETPQCVLLRPLPL